MGAAKTKGVQKGPYRCMTQSYNERWRVNMVKELTDVKWGENVIEGFSREELSYIMYQVCSC